MMQPFKIRITEKENLETIKTKIFAVHQRMILLESDEVKFKNSQLQINQKTNYLAQKLAEDRWKIEKVKYYKGSLFKVMLSKIDKNEKQNKTL